MLRKYLILPLAIFALMMTSCDRGAVSVGEYEHMRSRAEGLQAENDSLQFELSCLKMYVECLEEENGELVEELERTPVDRQ